MKIESPVLPVALCPSVGCSGARLGPLFIDEPAGKHLYDPQVPAESATGQSELLGVARLQLDLLQWMVVEHRVSRTRSAHY